MCKDIPWHGVVNDIGGGKFAGPGTITTISTHCYLFYSLSCMGDEGRKKKLKLVKIVRFPPRFATWPRK